MKNALLSTAIAGSVFLMSLVASGPTMAGGGHGGYGGHHSGYYGGHHGGDLAFGLVFGSVLGYAVANSNRTRSHGHASHAVEVAPQTRYSQRSTCLQAREYQTKVIVGGKAVDAYGTACLQRDGSWQHGPLTLSGTQY
ncbi:MAG TPA: hypothetical protein ENI80_00085 [Acidiferrobacteraceae bacterium]|nr:hypothetical protein [Acidiferrobacteraceae bacterium]